MVSRRELIHVPSPKRRIELSRKLSRKLLKNTIYSSTSKRRKLPNKAFKISKKIFGSFDEEDGDVSALIEATHPGIELSDIEDVIDFAFPLQGLQCVRLPSFTSETNNKEYWNKVCTTLHSNLNNKNLIFAYIIHIGKNWYLGRIYCPSNNKLREMNVKYVNVQQDDSIDYLFDKHKGDMQRAVTLVFAVQNPLLQ